ncbi:hypothetical protein E2562_014947, partial [Oryza meyeriana var. granulata]
MAEQHGHLVCGTFHDAYRSVAIDSCHVDSDASVKFAMSLPRMDLTEFIQHYELHVICDIFKKKK